MTSERITNKNIEERVANVNRRMRSRGAKYQYRAEGRNGYIGLDRIYLEDDNPRWQVHSTVTVGTKREVADFLHAMMVALDDAAIVEEHAIA